MQGCGRVGLSMLSFLKPRKKEEKPSHADAHRKVLADKIRSADDFGSSTVNLSLEEAVALLVFLQNIDN